MRQLVDQLWPTVLKKLRSDPEVSKHLSGWLTDHIWSALAYALREHHDRHALPEIEGGDIAWESPEEWAIEQRAFHAAGRYDVPADVQQLVAKLWAMYCHAAAPSASIEGETQ